LPLELRALPVKTGFTATPTDFNITANDFYVVTENASQVGPPTDTAASVAAACL
jgi:hypothetical protein